MNGIEQLLDILNSYRGKQIESEEELEAIVNIFGALQSCNLVFENAKFFISIQGMQLLLSLFKK